MLEILILICSWIVLWDGYGNRCKSNKMHHGISNNDNECDKNVLNNNNSSIVLLGSIVHG